MWEGSGKRSKAEDLCPGGPCCLGEVLESKEGARDVWSEKNSVANVLAVFNYLQDDEQTFLGAKSAHWLSTWLRSKAKGRAAAYKSSW